MPSIVHILLINVSLLVMSCFLLFGPYFTRKEKETFESDDVSIIDHSQSIINNPELPYSIGKNHFVIGGFCMQWGHAFTDKLDFPFKFDRVFAAYGTVGRTTGESKNVKVRFLTEKELHFTLHGGNKNIFWLAIGLKITPITNTLLM